MSIVYLNSTCACGHETPYRRTKFHRLIDKVVHDLLHHPRITLARKKTDSFYESLRLDEEQRRAGGAWDDVTTPCDRPSPGWHCNLQRGHDGPCPAWPDGPESMRGMK